MNDVWTWSTVVSRGRMSSVPSTRVRPRITLISLLRSDQWPMNRLHGPVNGQRSSSYREVKLWNSLPPEAKSIYTGHLQDFNKLTCFSILPLFYCIFYSRYFTYQCLLYFTIYNFVCFIPFSSFVSYFH